MESLELNFKTMVKKKCGIQDEALLDRIAKVCIEEVRGRDAFLVMKDPKSGRSLKILMDRTY